MAAMRVLVVEQDPLSRQLSREILTQLGYTVVAEADDGQDAIALTQLLEPDMVLMGRKMSSLDGLEATRYIRHTHCTPVFILTNEASPETFAQIYEAGAVGRLTKPPTVKTLAWAINQITCTRTTSARV